MGAMCHEIAFGGGDNYIDAILWCVNVDKVSILVVALVHDLCFSGCLDYSTRRGSGGQNSEIVCKLQLQEMKRMKISCKMPFSDVATSWCSDETLILIMMENNCMHWNDRAARISHDVCNKNNAE
jgi:hypothetical protein